MLNPIYIDSSIAGAQLSIGTTNTSFVNIGNANCSTTLVGTTNSSVIKSTSIDPITSGGTLNIGTITPSTINIGTASATAINVGSSGIATNINGVVHLARNTTGTNPTYIECVSGTSLNYFDFHCNSANATDYDARIICSGGTSTLGQADLQIASKSFNITSPLTLGSLPSLSTQLGYLKVGTVKASSTVIINGTQEIGSMTLDPGSWIISAYCNISPSSITTDNVGIRYSINTVTAVISTAYLLTGSEGVTYTSINTAPTLTGTAMVSITTTTTYYLNLTIGLLSGSATLGTVTHWNAMRIG